MHAKLPSQTFSRNIVARRSFNGIWVLFCWIVAVIMVVPAVGQERRGRPPGMVVPGAPPQPAPGEPAPDQPGEKPEGDAKKPEGEGKEEKSAPPEVIRREKIGESKGDPEELKVRPGEDGKVGFQFHNQGWVDLVEWLSDISDQPIDWQELPGDAVNLVSPQRLTVDETADLFNRHLLARGFTMLQLEGGIVITKTESVNSGMVRRVNVEDLSELPDHSFVRVTLDAGWLSAEKLSTELKPMLSASGKLTPLVTTNRIEAMDAAVNLRQVAGLLSEERDTASRDALAPEFRLTYIPAEDAKKLLEEFLGVVKEDAAPMSPQQMQMMRQMQQQNGEQAPPTKKEPEISIVANVRQNSVLVRAPIDRVAIAAEFIKRIDVPGGTLKSLADASSRVEVFRLVSLDAEKLVEIAREMNVLEPSTRFRVDKENKAVIVSGSAADRFIVGSLIERLDGGKRRLEVLQLRRLQASEVAESIAFLLGQKKEKKESSRRSYYWGYGDNDDEEKEEDSFRVAANSRFRQVLLWANESEMEEVRALLIKLGELPPPGGSDRTVRMIEASASPETLEYLEELRRQWESMSPNPLLLPDDSQFDDPSDAPETEKTQDDPLVKPMVAPEDEDLTNIEEGLRHLIQTQAKETPAAASEPIEIRVDGSGNLVLSSSDTEALDALENMMLQYAPPRRSYRVFEVKHASVTLMTFDLEDYFKEDDDKRKESEDEIFYRNLFGNTEEEDKPIGLAGSGKLRFVPNSDTSTIVVTNATAEQLRTIEELIRLWDVPEPVNARKSRFTKLVSIQYGRAEMIAETVKDAYRDLLSSKDKAFQSRGGGGGGKERGGEEERSNRDRGSGFEDSESGQTGGGEDFSFDGKLSIGVDQIGNTLLISAEGEPLLELIISMIEQLDTAAKPGGEIEIVQVSGELSLDTIREALTTLGASTKESSSDRSRSRSRNGSDRRRD